MGPHEVVYVGHNTGQHNVGLEYDVCDCCAACGTDRSFGTLYAKARTAMDAKADAERREQVNKTLEALANDPKLLSYGWQVDLNLAIYYGFVCVGVCVVAMACVAIVWMLCRHFAPTKSAPPAYPAPPTVSAPPAPPAPPAPASEHSIVDANTELVTTATYRQTQKLAKLLDVAPRNVPHAILRERCLTRIAQGGVPRLALTSS